MKEKTNCYSSEYFYQSGVIHRLNKLNYETSPFVENLGFVKSTKRNIYKAMFMKISHHRELLNEVCTLHICRQVHSSARCNKDISKVEQTVNALKQEKKVCLEQNERFEGEPGTIKATPCVKQVSKKSVIGRIIKEVQHYYHGFRLLFIDIRVALRYSWKMLKGISLSRRERRQLVRTTSDIFRLLPFVVFIIVPFMEFLLPVALKLFPNMLPSTFTEENKEQEKIRKKLKVKLEMAKFLQDTLEEMAITRKGAKGESVQEFTTFMEKIRSTGDSVSNEDILKYSQLFEDEITLDNLSYGQLRALCKLIDISVVDVSGSVLRFQLELKMRELEADDRMIQKEGIWTLEVWELQEACRARGMRSLGMPQNRLQAQLQQWLDLHLKSKIPTSLLLLSRSLYLPETIPTADKLKATISELPLTATEEAKVKVSEVLGDRIDNKAKIETIKQEEQIILAEKEDFAKEIENKEQTVEQTKFIEGLSMDNSIIDDQKDDQPVERPVPVLECKRQAVENNFNSLKGISKPVTRETEPEISPKDLSDIEDILESVAEERSKMSIEKEDLQELKQDVSDYVDSVEELKSVVLAKEEKDLKIEESKAAIHLRKLVNNMIVQMDSVVGDLLKEKEELMENIESKQVKFKQISNLQDDPALGQAVLDQISMHKKELIRVTDILLALKKIQKIPDDTKYQKIAQVAELLDTDHDGIIDIAQTLKVIEVIGRENVNLSGKQMSKIIELFKKEQLLEEEHKEIRHQGKQHK